MSVIDDEIVRMSFDNKQFESGVATSLGSIDKLKSSLSFQNAGKGLEDVSRSVGRFDMHPMTSAIEGVNKMWLGMATVAVTAISNITNKVIDAGLKMGKSLVVDPFTAGFAEYSTNLNSIQTIIANTGAKLPAVNETLRQLNEYSDKTIYNFGQMAQNIGRFTAAGVAMGPATDAIKGMANAAALSGATSEQLNSAMYQMSQALSTGVIRLMDWNSLANANMGGTNIQKALQETAKSGADAGAGMEAAIAKAGNFRDSLTEGWLTGDIFTKTMKVMAGQLDETTGRYKAFSIQQLQGMGYSAEAATELNRLSQAAIESATKVKTIGQAYDVIKESIGSGWAQVFQNIFGNFNQSKKLWTGVTEFITGGIGSAFDAINGYLEEWRSLGGRTDLLAGLKQGFKDFYRVFVPIRNAFKEVFPPQAGNALATFSSGFRAFFDLFRLNVKTMRVVREVFVAIFTAIKFAFGLIGDIIGAFKTLFGIVGGAGGGGAILGFVSVITDAVTAFVEWAQEGDRLGKMLKEIAKSVRTFFSGLKPLLPILQQIGDAFMGMVEQGYAIAGDLIAGILSGLNADTIKTAMIDLANNIVTWIKDALGIHSPAETMIPIGTNIILGIGQGIIDSGPMLLDALQKTFEVLATGLGLFVEGLGKAFADAMQNMDLETFLDIVNTLLTGGFLVAATNIAKAFSGVSNSASGVLDQISGSLKTMQSEVKADIIKSIAVSVLLLAGAAYILSQLDGKKLAVSMGAIAGLMAALTVSMKILMADKAGVDITGKQAIKKAVSMNGMALAMVAFAGAIVLLAGAVRIIGTMNPKEFEQGLKGVGLIVTGVVAATAILAKTGGGATIFATAAALVVLSVALTMFAGTMKLYSNLDWDMIIDGGGKAAAVIIGIGLAMRAFGKFAVTGSIGLAIASVALLILAKALKKIAGIDSEGLGNALVAVVVSIGAIALAALAMSGGGAVALIIGAAAIVIIAKALAILAEVPAKDLAKAVFFVALALGALALGAYLLGPAIPLIGALGTALVLFGAAVFLTGVGVLAFATALGILAVVGPAGFQVVADGINLLLGLLPKIGKAIGGFIISIIQGFIEALPELGAALETLWDFVYTKFIEWKPRIRKFFTELIDLICDVVENSADRIGEAFYQMVLDALDNYSQYQERIRNKGTRIVVTFLRGIADSTVRIANATGQMILDILEGIDAAVVKYEEPIRDAGLRLAFHLVDGMTFGLLTYGKEQVAAAAIQLANAMPGWMQKALGIDSPSTVMRDRVGKWAALGVASGITGYTPAVQQSSTDLANASLRAMTTTFNTSNKVAAQLLNIQPKITPILDLSNLANARNKIESQLGGTQPVITTTASRTRATDILASENTRQIKNGENAVGGDTYNFTQQIKSKDPIDHVKVYRGQKAQIALFREVTGK